MVGSLFSNLGAPRSFPQNLYRTLQDKGSGVASGLNIEVPPRDVDPTATDPGAGSLARP